MSLCGFGPSEPGTQGGPGRRKGYSRLLLLNLQKVKNLRRFPYQWESGEMAYVFSLFVPFINSGGCKDGESSRVQCHQGQSGAQPFPMKVHDRGPTLTPACISVPSQWWLFRASTISYHFHYYSPQSLVTIMLTSAITLNQTGTRLTRGQMMETRCVKYSIL